MTTSVLQAQNVVCTFTGLTGATNLEFDVVDGEGATLVARQAATLTGDVVNVTVAAADNTLAAGELWGLREVRLYATLSGGIAAVTQRSYSYRIVAQDQLPVPSASFVSLALAGAIVGDLVKATAWTTSGDAQRIAALQNSFLKIASYSYSYVPDDWQSRVSGRIGFANLFYLTASEWAAMDLRFKRALQRAQVLDAVGSLSLDIQSDTIDGSVTEITIGESTRKFSPGARVSRSLDERALRVLAPYLDGPSVGRA